jgi:hypothetical protein
MRPGHAANHSPPSCAEVKKERSYIYLLSPSVPFGHDMGHPYLYLYIAEELIPLLIIYIYVIHYKYEYTNNTIFLIILFSSKYSAHFTLVKICHCTSHEKVFEDSGTEQLYNSTAKL